MDCPFLIQHLLLIIVLKTATARCPKICSCSLKQGRKTVYCSEGGLTIVPTLDIDFNSHIIIITAPVDYPNNITIGRMFLKFPNLEIVRITHSNIPAIGDSSFWPGRRLKILDLSHNAIRFLRESDFNGLKNLRELDLNDNQISATPSAPFRYLTNLSSLSLARNRLRTLVPRFFYLLSNLQSLDLSGNSLETIDPENLQDVNGLRILKLAECRIKQLHPLLYQQLPHLEELDLRDNLISALAPEEFRHLISLRTLKLDGNMLSVILDDTFHGHTLQKLGLSRNNLTTLMTCAFCNTSVQVLDLSYNKLNVFNEDIIEPLSDSIEILNVSFNNFKSHEFFSMLHPLKNLRILRAANLLIEELPPDAFDETPDLKLIDLSRNFITEIPVHLFRPLLNIQQIDLSYNSLSIVNESTLRQLSNMTSLRELQLHGNPFRCFGCEIEALILWMNSSELFNESCLDGECLTCHRPDSMLGRPLFTVTRAELCPSATGYRSLTHTSHAGMVVAVSIIAVILLVIVVIVVIYRRHIAHYYTNEDKTVYDNPALANSGYADRNPAFLAA